MREASVGSRSTCETRASLALGSGKSRGLEKTSGTRRDTQYATCYLAVERPGADGAGRGLSEYASQKNPPRAVRNGPRKPTCSLSSRGDRSVTVSSTTPIYRTSSQEPVVLRF